MTAARATAAVVPATMDAVNKSGGDWRARFAWPRPFDDLPSLLAKVVAAYLDTVVAAETEDERHVLLLARPMMSVLSAVQSAHLVAAAAARNQRLVGHPLFDVLASEHAGTSTIELPPIGQHDTRIRLPWLRRAARTASWTPPQRLPRALLCPDGVALQHNSLMRAYLRNSPLAVRNAYDTDFDLDHLPVDSKFLCSIDSPTLAQRTAAAIVYAARIGAPISERLEGVLRSFLTSALDDAAALLGRLRSARTLPRLLVTGTGSKRVSRALGLEVMRRGGQAIRCEHGGSHVLLDEADAVALSELAVSSRFVVPTPEAAGTGALSRGLHRIDPTHICEVAGACGDPGLDVGRIALRRHARVGVDRRRRAMYVSTVYYGMHQVSPPAMPGPLYLDWQLRLLAELSAMPVEVIHKPHPEGLKPKQVRMSGSSVVVSAEPFEAAVADADILIYDYPASTTLALGLCTDRPIVLIDHGTMNFNNSVRPLIEQRCRILRAVYDDRNRPVVDREELLEAVCGGPDRADPTPFRRMLLGAA